MRSDDHEPNTASLPDDRLTTLDTSWTTIRTAHTIGPAGQAAMRDLIGRYHDAVERYLRLKLRDKNLADEVFQEFWTKLLDHKLAGADHSKGRFRDYLRTVLHRLIVDHFRGRKIQSLPPGDLMDPAAPDVEYDRVWREAIIRRVWSRLETYEASTPKNRYASVLHLRVENPDAAIEDLAEPTGHPDRLEGHARGVPQDPPTCPGQIPGAPDRGASGDDPPRHARGYRGRDLRPRARKSLPSLLGRDRMNRRETGDA